MATNGSRAGNGDLPTQEAGRPKRVRTGCLTCRERHLKCDETFPTCINCRKSARICKRGMRLNFIDTQCQAPPLVPLREEWHVGFVDESREIASEYKDGLQKYASMETEDLPQFDAALAFDFPGTMPSAPAMSHSSLPSMQGVLAQHLNVDQSHQSNFFDQRHQDSSNAGDAHESGYPTTSVSSRQQPFNTIDSEVDPNEDSIDTKEILTSSDETLYMQVFVEEVGIWMDSMDPMKHFSRIMPFHALGQPMLLNAFLACGVRHLTLVNPANFDEKKALDYYEAASKHLLRALQNPERDSVICATTAVILNVYEIMTEKALPRMNHIAGARALIKECGWNARSSGIGSACFWLNVGLETLSNLHFNWQSSWAPDDWGLSLELAQETIPGREEIWTHRILFIIAKIGDFRATIPHAQDSSIQAEQRRRQNRFDTWCQLRHLAETWNQNIPRTMQPMSYLYPYQTRKKSAFPEIWLIKRTTIIARLFYHTAMCLLAQVNPNPSMSEDMHNLEHYHAHQICGITAHVNDRGVASVALRSLAIAAECLTVRREQEEVLQIFTQIHRDTGWRLGFLPKDLREKWGWDPEDPYNVSTSPSLPMNANPHLHLPPQQMSSVNEHSSALSTPQTRSSQISGGPYQFDQYAAMQNWKQQQALATQQQSATQQKPDTPSPRQPKPPQGIVNPMFAGADFAMAKHPYQDHYVAPNHSKGSHGDQGLGLGLELSQGLYGGLNGIYQFG